MANVIVLQPGESLSVLAAPAQPVGIWGPTDPRPTNPIAGFDPIHGTFPTPPIAQPPVGIWGPGDPRPTNPIFGFDRWTGKWPDSPPPTQPPTDDSGNWTWAWSPQAGRWVWVKVPGEGEAGPKA